MKERKVKKTERGWAGHFICADRCLFRRNTLLECDKIKVVVSTVGLMREPLKEKITEIGCDRHFETMAFHSKKGDKRYHDADVTRQIDFESPWSISEEDADDKANDMHEVVVDEIMERLKGGARFPKKD